MWVICNWGTAAFQRGGGVSQAYMSAGFHSQWLALLYLFLLLLCLSLSFRCSGVTVSMHSSILLFSSGFLWKCWSTVSQGPLKWLAYFLATSEVCSLLDSPFSDGLGNDYLFVGNMVYTVRSLSFLHSCLILSSAVQGCRWFYFFYYHTHSSFGSFSGSSLV